MVPTSKQIKESKKEIDSIIESHYNLIMDKIKYMGLPEIELDFFYKFKYGNEDAMCEMLDTVSEVFNERKSRIVGRYKEEIYTAPRVAFIVLFLIYFKTRNSATYTSLGNFLDGRDRTSIMSAANNSFFKYYNSRYMFKKNFIEVCKRYSIDFSLDWYKEFIA